jgi:hypothetical protein
MLTFNKRTSLLCRRMTDEKKVLQHWIQIGALVYVGLVEKHHGDEVSILQTYFFTNKLECLSLVCRYILVQWEARGRIFSCVRPLYE